MRPACWCQLDDGPARRGTAGEALHELPPIPDTNQWSNFVKNHDKLTLDKLSKAERDEVFAALAPSQDMRIYDRGIRRRVPPMLKGDQRHYPQSLLNWMDRLIRRRKETPQLGWGSFQVVATGDEAPGPAPPGVGRSEDEAKSAAVRPALR